MCIGCNERYLVGVAAEACSGVTKRIEYNEVKVLVRKFLVCVLRGVLCLQRKADKTLVRLLRSSKFGGYIVCESHRKDERCLSRLFLYLFGCRLFRSEVCYSGGKNSDIYS